MTPPLPRLALSTIERGQISAWLARHAQMPLRLLFAPAGSGKTTALTLYARTRPVFFIHLEHRNDDRSLESYFCEITNMHTYHHAAFIAAMEVHEAIEIIIDGIENLHANEEALLERLVQDVPSHIGLIFAGTRSAIDFHRLEAAGLAAVLPRDELFFSLEEAQQLCSLMGLSADDEQLAAIHDHCDGWAVVIADVLRIVEEHETAVIDAYELWVAQRGRSFAAYIKKEMSRLPADGSLLFERALRGNHVSDDELTALEDAGAFILTSSRGVRPYRVVSHLLEQTSKSGASKKTHVMIRMFGRFSIRSGEREVAWIRRRDQQIFRYIALRPDSRAQKAEITEMFWPNADPHLAAQSIRTACSNIRKALVNVVDSSEVEHLFVTNGQELHINLEHVVVDVRRFMAHINEANEADNDGRAADALAHYYAADRLYRADLFGGEPDEAWFIPQREVYRSLALLSRERITALSDEIAAAEYSAHSQVR